MNVTFSSLTEILSCYGNASIQYQWTNNNTSIGLAASGTGNISFIATQPGTAFYHCNTSIYRARWQLWGQRSHL
ncbi:MAG: hypothetical protein IPN46_09575 [Saprospiraceae bacterium]|nr:hypothetical protein [Saprospiraceae bacterium]